ncbi:hypothetical protein [Streptomyces sp. NPDC050287]|uniref:hypothetical protein n=1 Tax=Streptomyces sp. NPDC050287 TaxID=3365608 RepID=UPI003789883F
MDHRDGSANRAVREWRDHRGYRATALNDDADHDRRPARPGEGGTGMVIVELLVVSVGFGGLILEYRSRFEAPRLYATIVIVLVRPCC